MGSAQEPPLDERVWHDPAAEASFGGVHSNTVLFYFAQSPFFDPTSNNQTVFTQGLNNADMARYLGTREDFEGRLRDMQGLEFVVSHDPLARTYPVGELPSNIWVIQKRRRRKARGSQDEVTVLAVYFMIGNVVFMSPKIGDVLASRMLSTVTSLNRFLSTTSTLPIFTPSLGYTYMPPTLKSTTTAATAGSTQQSREGTPLVETQSFNTATSKTTSPAKTSTSGSFTDSNILADSFRRATSYGTEYMDDNPLIGEPGSFIISKSQQSGPEKTPSQSQSSRQLKPVPTPAGTKSGSRTNTPTPSPIEIKTEIPNLKRQNPSGQKSPMTPGGSGGGLLREKPKRRKSKAPGSGMS